MTDYTQWLIPSWGWWIMLCIILIISPFLAWRKTKLEVDRLQKVVDDKKGETEFKLRVDKLIQEGTQLRPVLNAKSAQWVDRNNIKIDEWQIRIESTLKDTEWEIYWQNSVELGTPPNQANMTDIEYESAVQRYRVNLKLNRLDTIRDKL